ncbi:MAG: hypothetical protein K6G80_05980 [Treponema sp.]|nr:hypothetical protein [Treponema sp.]
MFVKIVKEYGNLFSGAGRVLALLALCTATGAAFVIPLWKFATSAPRLYSIVILILLASCGLYLLVKKIRKHGIKKALRFFLLLLIILAGVAGAMSSVLAGSRLFAALILITTVIIHGILSFGIRSHDTTPETM